jgi:mRNA-degrading endonuclease RelE of RelBE toxin-antitoxin system
LPQSIQDLTDLAVSDLEEQGINPEGWNSLKTNEDEYRIRLNYRYRMRYRVTDEQTLEIEVFYVGHRREAYR